MPRRRRLRCRWQECRNCRLLPFRTEWLRLPRPFGDACSRHQPSDHLHLLLQGAYGHHSRQISFGRQPHQPASGRQVHSLRCTPVAASSAATRQGRSGSSHGSLPRHCRLNPLACSGDILGGRLWRISHSAGLLRIGLLATKEEPKAAPVQIALTAPSCERIKAPTSPPPVRRASALRSAASSRKSMQPDHLLVSDQTPLPCRGPVYSS